MTHRELRKKYFNFMKEKGFEIIPSSSLVPENDPSVLFTTAGVQPLIPYLMGESHPKGNKIANIQKCVRTQDIDEVGDKTHDTFFEMLGYWYLNSEKRPLDFARGKEGRSEKELIEKGVETSFEFYFTEKGIDLDVHKAYITCFESNEVNKKDEVSRDKWIEMGIPEDRIFYLNDNWWNAGENGPCGPDTEIFYNVSGKDLDLKSVEDFKKADDDQDIVEIGNTVFMLFEKRDGKVVGELGQQNVDFGGGFERVLMALQGTESIFETDVFFSILQILENGEKGEGISEKEIRIIADHIRTSVMIINDGVEPSNTDQGYVLRRLIRRFTRLCTKNNIKEDKLKDAISATVNIYKDEYDFIDISEIERIILGEVAKFKETLEKGLKEFNKLAKSDPSTSLGARKGEGRSITGRDAFILHSTYGFPFEMTKELAQEEGVEIDEEDFEREINRHKELSRTATKGKFKGGLSGNSEIETRYHTATHLLNAALRQILGDHIIQKGSNINEQRMRFDFNHDEKIERETLDLIENKVNEWINAGIEVIKKEMSYEDAKSLGAIGVFDDKYGDVVSIYTIGDISKEFCGGPHVKNTSEIGKFKITKEESSSRGVRRIKAILE